MVRPELICLFRHAMVEQTMRLIATAYIVSIERERANLSRSVAMATQVNGNRNGEWMDLPLWKANCWAIWPVWASQIIVVYEEGKERK